MINYTTMLREHNLKATPQRLAITDTLHLNGHVTIEDLYDVLLKKFHSISLATIYKNINIMLENAFIQEVKVPHTKAVFELTKESHSHLICDNCSSIEDIYLNLDTVLTSATNASSFQANSASIVICGLCKNCQ